MPSHKPRRLLAAGPLPPPINGMSAAFRLAVDGLRARGWELDLVDLADRSGAGRGQRFSGARARAMASAVAGAARKMRSADLFYLTISQSRLGFAKDAMMLAAAHALRKPAVVHMHGGNFHSFWSSQPLPVRLAIRAALEPVKRVIVLGESLKSDFRFLSRASERVVAVPNACEVPVGAPRKAPQGRLRVLYLSNLVVEKGYLDLLEAVPALAAALPGVELEVHFAGAFGLIRDEYANLDEMRRDFEGRVSRLGGHAKLVHHGVVSGEAKNALLKEADVFALPTYYVNEGQPISILEALASGLPVLSTDYRGIPEILPPEMRPLLVPPRDPKAIATSLARLATEPGLYEALSAAAIRGSSEYRPERHLDRLQQVLEAASADR